MWLRLQSKSAETIAEGLITGLSVSILPSSRSERSTTGWQRETLTFEPMLLRFWKTDGKSLLVGATTMVCSFSPLLARGLTPVTTVTPLHSEIRVSTGCSVFWNMLQEYFSQTKKSQYQLRETEIAGNYYVVDGQKIDL